jgi:hypothetical protein
MEIAPAAPENFQNPIACLPLHRQTVKYRADKLALKSPFAF